MSGQQKKSNSGEVFAVIRRVLAENGRDFIPQYMMAGICMLVIALTTAFTAWIMKSIIDDVFYDQRGDLIYWIGSAIVIAFLLRGIATYGQAVLLAQVGNNIVARYQRRIFTHLLRLDMSFFNNLRSGQLASRITQNVTGIRDLLNMTLSALVRDLVSLLGLIGVMIYQDPILSLSALLIGPPLFFTVNYLMRRLRHVTREAVEINAHLLGAMQEAVQGITIIKAFTMERVLTDKIGRLIDNAEARSNKIARVSERLNPISEALAGFAIAAVIVYAGWRAAVFNEPPGSVFSFITALLLAYDPARRLARVQVSIERSLVNARMIYEILDLEPKQRDVPDAASLSVPKGEISFKNVHFAYSEEAPLLRNFSLIVPAGTTTAIVGASGAGKSTLFALLQRFYDLDDGRIEIDGQDISRVSKQSLRENIAYVSQHPYLFEGSIRDNIRYGRCEASDEEVEEAARLANAEDFILQQENGYATLLGENGSNFSGGQRQRLSIARAILRNAPILLLDEATSALDNESEIKVQQALERSMIGRTTLVIAHRLSTVVNADKIVVLDNGYLMEEGTHSELTARRNGIYARFYHMQRKGAEQLLENDEPSSPSQALP